MISGRIGDAVATLAVVCVLTIFLFPAMQGPYSVVHGPASALLAARAAAKVRTAIVQAALRSIGALTLPLVALCGMFVAETVHYTLTLPERSAILRC
jgi:predicted exporter